MHHVNGEERVALKFAITAQMFKKLLYSSFKFPILFVKSYNFYLERQPTLVPRKRFCEAFLEVIYCFHPSGTRGSSRNSNLWQDPSLWTTGRNRSTCYSLPEVTESIPLSDQFRKETYLRPFQLHGQLKRVGSAPVFTLKKLY